MKITITMLSLLVGTSFFISTGATAYDNVNKDALKKAIDKCKSKANPMTPKQSIKKVSDCLAKSDGICSSGTINADSLNNSIRACTANAKIQDLIKLSTANNNGPIYNCLSNIQVCS
jgi:hypothetical protein